MTGEKGVFIVFEGLDGAGTTTQMKILGGKFSSGGKNVFITHEPTDNPIGKLVRACLQKKFTTTPRSLALLYASDRDDHLDNPEYGINGRLLRGEVVISDRYFYSTLAYQGVECDYLFLKEINSSFRHADIIIFVDTPVDECMARIEKRGEEKELFEKKEYLTAVRENYIKQFKELPPEVTLITIDGTLTIEDAAVEIEKALKRINVL